MFNLVTSPRRRAGLRLGVLASAAAAFALLTAPAQAQTFDAATQFSIVNGNPNGVWSYGFSSGLAGTFNLYDVGTTFGFDGSTFRVFRSSSSTISAVPFIGVNDGPNAVRGTAVGQLALHSGPDAANLNTVLRFTAPTADTYTLSSQFFAGDTGETDITVFLNGNTVTPLFSSATTTTNPTFGSVLALNAGDIVSFSLGPSGDGFNFDTTPTNVTFVGTGRGNVAAPEPGTLALLLPAGMGLIGVARRRRK